jgi:hypothetical protein
MPHREKIVVHCTNHREYTDTVCGRSTEFLVLKFRYMSIYKPMGFKGFTQTHDLASGMRTYFLLPSTTGPGISTFQSDSIVHYLRYNEA